MPRAFTNEEYASILSKIESHARTMFETKGFRHTSVEEITNAAGIAKGSFYRFFDTKEALYFSLLEQTQAHTRAPFKWDDTSRNAPSKEDFETALTEAVSRIRKAPLLRDLGDGETISKIVRKLPPEQLIENQRQDRAFVKRFIDTWCSKAVPPSQDQIGVHFAMLLLIQTNDGLLGERLYPHAEAMVINSFVGALFDE